MVLRCTLLPLPPSLLGRTVQSVLGSFLGSQMGCGANHDLQVMGLVGEFCGLQISVLGKHVHMGLASYEPVGSGCEVSVRTCKRWTWWLVHK